MATDQKYGCAIFCGDVVELVAEDQKKRIEVQRLWQKRKHKEYGIDKRQGFPVADTERNEEVT